MMRIGKTKFFVLSASKLEYKEVRLFKTKLLGSSLLLGLFHFAILIGVNLLVGDPFGIGFDKVSTVLAENGLLKEKLRSLTKQTDAIQKSLQLITERGNELRLMVDLSKIDDDTRKAATGGSNPASDWKFVSAEAGNILSQTGTMIDQLSREVKLQQTSYEEVYKRYEYNRARFAHLPAIKPMDGYYSINGFGMRIHPVLRVYRMHEGVDIINDVGTNVFAAGDGIVRFAGRTQGGYGAVVDIVHGFGYSSLYAHLSKVVVRPGQSVKRGELLGQSGRSGLVSGPHLHYEVRLNGRKQNPVDYFFDDVAPSRYRARLASSEPAEH